MTFHNFYKTLSRFHLSVETLTQSVLCCHQTIGCGTCRDDPPASKGTGTWSFSTISGNWKRGTGILNNELYNGERVWNRQRYIKDPNTGKRQARLIPESEWVRNEVPDLRLIDADLWQRVKQRQGVIRATLGEAQRSNSSNPLARVKRT